MLKIKTWICDRKQCLSLVIIWVCDSKQCLSLVIIWICYSKQCLSLVIIWICYSKQCLSLVRYCATSDHKLQSCYPLLFKNVMTLPCFAQCVQLELQDSPRHLGIYNETSKELMSLLTAMLSRAWDGTHTCIEELETVNCQFCQNIALWHQLASQVWLRT